MNTKKKLEFLVKRLVSRAFDFADEKYSSDDFYKLWIDSVAKDTGIDREKVLNFHHPVWQELTLDDDSVLEYYQADKNGDKSCVRLRNQEGFITLDMINDYSRKIMKKYKPWLEARAERYLS